MARSAHESARVQRMPTTKAFARFADNRPDESCPWGDEERIWLYLLATSARATKRSRP